MGQRHTAKILPTLSIQHSDLAAAGASFSGMVQAGSGGQYQPNPKEQHSAKWQLPEDWSSTSGQKSLMMVALLGSSAGFELQLLDDLLDLLWTYPYLSNIIIYTL